MNKQTKLIVMMFAVALFFGAGVQGQDSSPTPPASGTKSSPGSASSGSTSSTTKPAKPGTGTATKTGAATAAKHPVATPLKLTTPKQKTSYAIGENVGQGLAKSLQRDQLDIDPAILTRAIRDALTNAKPAMTDAEIKTTMDALKTEVTAKREAAAKTAAAANQVAGEANKKAGEAFLAANKTKDKVVTLPSGLQYKVITQGTGPKPSASDTVVCNYRGTLIDGQEFDASSKHGGPASFPVSGVIKGWTEALQLMPVGSKWELFIPSDMAYGPSGAGGDIGPNSTLVFEVELVSIKGK
ncbi:MAG: FKBP-type peptidyl-prolyl cis-trans isomerase [Candidatus Acidiferrales bacterium]